MPESFIFPQIAPLSSWEVAQSVKTEEGYKESSPALLFAEEKEVYLFRGDIGLPIGLPPLSPVVRLLLSSGWTLQDAFDMAARKANSLVTEEPHTDFFEYSEFATYDNPTASATKSLSRAVQYATGFGHTTNTRGYVSLLRVKLGRFIDLARFYGEGVAAEDKEIAIAIAISDSEIMAQIPVQDLLMNFELPRIMEMEQRSDLSPAIEFMKPPQYRFQLRWRSLACPNCKGDLYPYLAEFLGPDESDFEVFKLPPLTSSDEHSWFPDIRDRQLRMLGFASQCIHCESLLMNRKRVEHEPLSIEIERRKKNKLQILARNTTAETIRRFQFIASYDFHGKIVEDVDGFDLHVVIPFNLKGRRIDWFQTLIDRRIGPYGTLKEKIVLSHSPTGDITFKIAAVDFESGRRWVPLERILHP